MSKQVQTKATNQVANFAAMADDVFDDLRIDASDILIPKILLMQPSSQFVGADKARVGEFIVSTTGRKVGSIAEPLVIIPFYNRKSWDIVNKDAGNKFIRNEPFTPANANLPWKDKEGGMNIHRYQRMDYFCLVPDLMKEGSVLPAVVSFKSTGYKVGNLIISEWAEVRTRNQKAKEQGRLEDVKLPFHTSFVLSGQKLQNQEKQTYCVPVLQLGTEVDAETQKTAYQWLQTIKAAKNIVVDEDEGTHDAEPTDVNNVEDKGTGAF